MVKNCFTDKYMMIIKKAIALICIFACLFFSCCDANSQNESPDIQDKPIKEASEYWPAIKYDGRYFSYGSLTEDLYTVSFSDSDDTQAILDNISGEQEKILELYPNCTPIDEELSHAYHKGLPSSQGLTVNDKDSELVFDGEYRFYITDDGILMLWVYNSDGVEKLMGSTAEIAKIWKEVSANSLGF